MNSGVKQSMSVDAAVTAHFTSSVATRMHALFYLDIARTVGIYCATPQKLRRPRLHKTFYVHLYLQVPNNKKEKKNHVVRAVPELGNIENRIGRFTSEKVYAFFFILFCFRAVSPSFLVFVSFFSFSLVLRVLLRSLCIYLRN